MGIEKEQQNKDIAQETSAVKKGPPMRSHNIYGEEIDPYGRVIGESLDWFRDQLAHRRGMASYYGNRGTTMPPELRIRR